MLHQLLNLFKPKYVYRSAITGKFVSYAFALLHPRETVRERVR